MSTVVEFLQTVEQEDEHRCGQQLQSSPAYDRMLSVCGEFFRISRLVLEKAEKESMTRRKRKNEESRLSQQVQQQQVHQHQKNMMDAQKNFSGISNGNANANANISTSSLSTTGTPPALSPQTNILRQDMNAQLYADMANNPTFSPGNTVAWLPDLSNPTCASTSTYPVSPINQLSGDPFQQPFVPQDLWQMPMTFEWDWADVTTNMPWGDGGF